MGYNKIWETDSKLNNVELVKLKKDGLDIIATIIEMYATDGYSSITEDDRTLLKWAGIYEQKPRDGHFMLRVRINSCILDTKQARVLADISKTYGRDVIKITSRGAIQFYHITLSQLPEIFTQLKEVQLSSYEACGDCPRTIVGNPLAGIDRNELMDTSVLVDELNRFFLLNKDFSNLPRKFKMSVSSSTLNVAHKEINDLSFTPAVKTIDGTQVTGFQVSVGGGLSINPHMAKPLDLFVRPNEVLKVAEGIATIFRDHGYREKRHHARLKFLVEDWGREKFKEELLKLTGPLDDQGTDMLSDWNGALFHGIHPQKQQGKSYLGLHIPAGFMDADSLLQLADFSDQYGDSKLRTTMSQNIILSGVDHTKVQELIEKPFFEKFSVSASGFLTNMVVCTGSKYCNLALVETQERAKNIAQFLDENIDFLPVRINLVGCPNSCGHALIADIGLRGCVIKTDGKTEEAFELFLGGVLGASAAFGIKLKGRVPGTYINEVILDMIRFYKENRYEEEAFHNFINRVDRLDFQTILEKYITVV